MGDLTKLVNGISKTIGIGLAGLVFYGTVSCATMTEAQKTALFGESLSILGGQNIAGTKTKADRFANELMVVSGGVITNQSRMQHDLEVAKAGRDQIVINTPQPNYQNPNQNNNLLTPQPNYQNPNQNNNLLTTQPNYQNPNQNNNLLTPQPNYQNPNQNNNLLTNLENEDFYTPQGFFMYKKVVDFNNDGGASKNEYIGLNESIYDIRNLENLKFSFFGAGDKSYDLQDLSLKIYSMEDGEIINYFNEKYSGGVKIQNFYCESKYFIKSGRYKAVLNTSNNKTFFLDFEVIK
ncbi:MAG: hypothetical protein AABY32_05985 [Nanoarchaeota archaeon]